MGLETNENGVGKGLEKVGKGLFWVGVGVIVVSVGVKMLLGIPSV